MQRNSPFLSAFYSSRETRQPAGFFVYGPPRAGFFICGAVHEKATPSPAIPSRYRAIRGAQQGKRARRPQALLRDAIVFWCCSEEVG